MHDPMLHWIRGSVWRWPSSQFALMKDVPQHPFSRRWRYLPKAQGVPMDRVCSRSPQVSGRYCRRMWLGTANKGVLMRAHTSHLSVQRFPPSGRSEQWRYEGPWGAGGAASWRETTPWWPQGARRRLLRLVLFSFPLGSEVLFGLVFTELVYKQDFWSMGKRSLADTFLPLSLFPAQFNVKGKKNNMS